MEAGPILLVNEASDRYGLWAPVGRAGCSMFESLVIIQTRDFHRLLPALALSLRITLKRSAEPAPF